MVLQSSDFLFVPKPCENPKARLVCFPHSGGGPAAFATWPDLLEAHQIEVVAVSPPGRERRVGHPLLTDWRELVTAVCEALISSSLVDDVPYAFFGHSLGALIAYEAARRLDAELEPGRPRPVHLFASGHGGPATKGQARDISDWGRLHTLTDAALVRAVQAFGFLPAELAADEGLMRAVVPALRADLHMYEDYAPEADRKPLPLGITALGGREDAVAPTEHLGTWAAETSQALVGPELFPGGHFFIETCRAEVLASIRSRLLQAMDALPRSVFASSLALPEACNELMQEVVLEVSRRQPETQALVGETERLTYGELAHGVQLLARKLQNHHLHGKAGQVVALLMAHEPTYVTCMLGIWHAAAVLIVIEAHFPAALCKDICEESGTVAALCSPEHASKFQEVSGCETLVLQGDWAASLAQELEGLTVELPRPGVQDLSILMMTSGTTGRPKTIAGSNHFLHVGARAKAQLLPYGEEDCREGFNVMFVWEVVRPLLLGLTSFIIPDEAVLDPQLFVSTLQKHRCSRVLTTPSLLATVMQYCARDLDLKLHFMRTWLLCGEVLPLKTVQTFRQLLPDCRLANIYSTWESGDVGYAVVAPKPAYEPSAVFAAAGEVAPGCRAAIVDPENKRVLPLGVPGELYIGGSALSSGYYAQAEVTAAKFVDPFSEEMKEVWPGKWYKTGDSGRFVGSPPILEVRGRIDSTVKIRGFKVGLPVVEAAVQETSGVAICAVIPVYESPAVVDSLLCFLKLEDGLSFEEVVQRVKREAVQRIPRWMMPAYFKPMPEALSGGESRKLDRKRLAQLFDLQSLREGQAAEQPLAKAEPEQEGDDEEVGVRAIVRAVWAKSLNLNPQALDLEENFFDIGGHSTLAAKIAAELSNDYGLPVTVLDIYSHSSLGALLDFVDSKNGAAAGAAVIESRRVPRGGAAAAADGIAIVGIAGRFPGADDVDAFWENLKRGTVSATFLSKDFLRSKGVPEATVNHKDFVPCAYKINDADKFDNAFFGIGRHEASIMDPQHRVFVETTWAALENAAIPPRTGLSDTVVGVFAAAGIDGYLVHHLDGMPLKDSMDPQDIFLAEIGNEKDYIATRVSYLLDFTGPSMNVNSACSSALVACVQSAAAITAGQCDAAVAGASSITFPNLGFLYQDGLVNSIDGYVRPFDEKADGTVFGDAVASLVLRRRDEAGSLVWGAMRGFAVTNDGGQKAGYAAPSPMGQSMAVMGAMRMMGEDPWSLSYVECHCTGTRVGDGIEVRGLMDAFAQLGGKRGAGEASIALGSVKGNIAHANCAAGATGLIKVLEMLRSRSIAPTANFAKLNPKINLDRSPFFVNPELCSWEVEGRPLRAGVSSFGIGGTNAHVILDEARPAWQGEEAAAAGSRKTRWGFHVLPLSARTPEALHAGGQRLAEALRSSGAPRDDLDRVAYTLQAGRAGLPLRKALVLPVVKAEGVQEDLSVAAEVLQSQLPDVEELEELEEAGKRPQVAFVFPGQGSQYFGMARGLYSHVPLFRQAADRCCELLAEPERLGLDLRPLLFPSSTGGAEEERQRETDFALPSVLQPGLFIVEYSLAQVFLAVGITPVAAAGHSLGEYAAAVTGGLLSLESAASIVAARAKSTETLAEDGSMLSVAEWTEQELTEVGRGKRPGLWLAAVNSPAHAVISGETAAVEALEAELKEAGRKCTKLHVRKAFHSGLIAKAADTLKGLGLPEEAAAGAAGVPVASNFTGGWLNALQLKDGTYWTSHMRGTVRWRDNAVKLLTQWQPAAVLEVGPGSALSTLTAKCVGADQTAPAFVQATRHPKATRVHDVEALLGALGRLWEVGCAVDWQALHTKVLGVTELPQLLRLPSYAFDRTTLWANPERSVYVDSVEEPAPAAYSQLAQGGPAAAPVAAPAPRLLMRYGERLPQEPSIRAYCLPFASGSATLFAPWAEQPDTAFEVVALELPGRGARADESMPAGESEDEGLLDTICDAIMADLQGAKYVLVGFSMGGGLCADLALRLAARGAPAPLALYIAGRRPPAMDPASIGPITMSNEELAEYAFAPPEVAQSPEFAEHVVPLLRGDLEVDARCERRLSTTGAAGGRLPPGVGLELFCGTDDGVAPWREAPGWQRFAQEPVGMHYFPGGHEFMQECRPLLHAAIRRDALARLVRQRSMELALLAAQGLAAPGAPVALPVPASASAPAKPEKRELPLYAVRWAPATASDSQVESAALHIVALAEELPEASLVAAVAAVRAGTPALAVCRPGAGVFSSDPMEAEVRQAWHFVQLVQRLLEEGCAGRLLLACPAAASGAMVAGASKAVALEASELRIQRMFLPSASFEGVEARAGALLKLAQRHGQETDIWVQDEALQGPVFAPRLELMAEPSTRLPCFPKRSPDGSLPVFILTGATGGLGKAVVEWMLKEQGLLPEQLVLLRRAGSAPLSGELARCRAVEVTRVDSEEALLASPLRELRGVAGVLHLAGVLDDGVVQGMTEERMRKVAVPKCDLLAALLRAARALSWPLRWAVGFSSTSSLFGYPGQVNYCAANAVLDQLAAFGGAGQLPEGDQAPCRVLAINWGPWAEAGMAKVGTKAYEQALQDGDTPLPNATALACLAAALRVAAQAQPAAAQFCACDVDWQRSQWSHLPVLELLGDDLGPVAAAAAAAAAAPAASGASSAAPASGGDARKAVEDFLLQHAKSGSSWKRVQGKSLHQLGLDSLEIVQVRNLFNKRFGVSVPLGVVADSSRKLGELTEDLMKHVQQ